MNLLLATAHLPSLGFDLAATFMNMFSRLSSTTATILGASIAFMVIKKGIDFWKENSAEATPAGRARARDMAKIQQMSDDEDASRRWQSEVRGMFN